MVFDKLKENLIKRIEENSIKSDLVYTDNEGIEHTETVYLKRGKGRFGDWHQVYLPVDEETKKWNIPNALFGGKRNLIKLLFYLGVVALFLLISFQIKSLIYAD